MSKFIERVSIMNMEIRVARRKSKKVDRTYEVMFVDAPWGEIPITYEKATILQVLPSIEVYTELDEKGVPVGYISR